ncbi:MAG: DUF1934 domain-containing protein [Pelosinus sp.]|nr:DUF1934 domain-containing protein [Pelosinus sp.]
MIEQKNENNVLVTVTGTQTDADGEENCIELTTTARYWQKNGVEYIIYHESAVSGLEKTTTALKVYPERVALVRMGGIEQKQEFKVGEKSLSTYITPYGVIKMGVMTNKLDVFFSEAQGTVGTIDIRYDLEIDGQWQSANSLTITVREEQERGYKRTITGFNTESSRGCHN